jgi:CubicO group peptidase (beta-lactamase class C family)
LNPKDKILDDAVKNHDVPFVVAATGDSKGITYAGAAGDATPGRKAGQDTVFRIFSMTKAVGSTAAMILIDRGKLDPESPVEDILPEFSKIKVLEGFDGDKPKLRAPRTKATIRQLATHTGGLEYEFWNSSILEYQQKTGTAGILVH